MYKSNRYQHGLTSGKVTGCRECRVAIAQFAKAELVAFQNAWALFETVSIVHTNHFLSSVFRNIFLDQF